MNRGAAAQGLAVAALLGVALWRVSALWVGPRLDLGPYRALGAVAAEEAAAMIGGKGRLVLVVADPGPGGDPVQACEVAAFRKALSASREVTLAAVEEVGMDPVTRMQTGGAIPPDRLSAVCGRHADAKGLVLFMPYPPVDPPGLSPPGGGALKVMVVSALLPGYDAMLKSGTMHVAIVPRFAENEGTPGSEAAAAAGGARAEFDREYQILRAP